MDIDIATMLFLQYKKPIIDLNTIVSDYLPHLSEDTAKRRAHACQLPFPAFKTDDSQKSIYYVNIGDLAVWLDKEREQARQDWRAMNE